MYDILRVLGGPKRVCAGVTRRDLMLAGGLGLLGQGLTKPSHAATTEAPKATAKNVILLYLFGGPSQLETFDPKPDAPQEVRGTIGSIETSLPGCRISEGLPMTAQIMDRCTLVRSLTHPWNFHGMMWTTTNVPESNVPTEETQRIDKHWPYVGSVFEYLRQLEHGPLPVGAVPHNLMLPFLLSSKRPAIPYARPHGSFLGYAFDPLWTEFHGEATRSETRWSHGPKTEIRDPYLGTTPAARFALSEEATLPTEITVDRLDRRRSLLTQFDEQLRQLDRSRAGRLYDQQRSTAFSLLNSPALAQAFDLDDEPAALREAYGMNLFGQSTLQARRLVESGCRFVTVIWDEFGQLNAGWDTHVDHYNRLKTELLPGLDAAFSTLIHDLERRGLLDETLVCVVNEMGRTPRFQAEGRGHWGIAYSNLFAGGGIKRGAVVGQTDHIAGTVTDRPLSAKDVLATQYHLLGYDPHSTPHADRQNRPLPLASGDVVPEMVA